MISILHMTNTILPKTKMVMIILIKVHLINNSLSKRLTIDFMKTNLMWHLENQKTVAEEF